MNARLTVAQREIWLAEQLGPPGARYNLCEYADIAGPVDEASFERAVRDAVSEVDSLNLRITKGTDGRPVLHPAASEPWPFEILDLSGTADPAEAARSWMARDVDQPTNLAGWPLAGALIKLSERRSFWYQRYHHIAVDGFGMSLIAQRVAQLYSAHAESRPPDAARFGSVAGVLREDEAYRQSDQYTQDAAYWRDRLAGWTGPSTLTPHAPAAAAPTCLRAHRHLPEAAARTIRRACETLGTSLPRLLTGATAIHVHRVRGTTELSLSFVMGAREPDQLAPVTMANIVPLRLRIRPDSTVSDVVGQVGAEIRGAKAHQYFRYEDIRRTCLPQRLRRSTFGPMVNVYRFDYGFTLAGHRVTGANLATGPIDDISFSFHDRSDGNGITVIAEANPRVYTLAETEAHLRRLTSVLEQLAGADPRTPVHRIGGLTDAERGGILNDLCAGPDGFLPSRVDDLFAEQRLRTPDAPAVTHAGRSMSYAELDTRANKLAHFLVAQGVQRGDVVAVAMSPGHDQVVALLATWKAGAAYVPVDPGHPPGRIKAMIDDARPAFLLTAEAVAGAAVRRYLATSPPGPRGPDDPAYVIYTSGSTGRPKGVAVTHRSVHAYLRFATASYPGLASSALVHTPISFDLTVTGLFGPLIAGGQVILADRVDGDARSVKATPAHLPLLETASPDSLILGGEQLLWESLARWRRANPGATVYNEYGPTEATVGCSVYPVRPGDAQQGGPVPIGRPVAGARLYVLDSMLGLLPPGIVGELYIGGDGVAIGYLGKPAMTAERFVADPFGPPGSRMYRTGDQAFWRPDGNLVFSGRTDAQVKIRGYRIELGEIEATLVAHRDVDQAVAAARPVGPRDHQLVAYLTVPRGRPAPDPDELRAWVADRLPDYMLPRDFVVLDELPLTTNGKLDRSRLPAPPSRSTPAGRAATPHERMLCDSFARILGLERVSPDDDFFDLGGSSLTGIQLVAWVRTTLRLGFDLPELFQSRTPARLAGRLVPRRSLPALGRRAGDHRAPLSYQQQRLWYLAKLHGHTGAYHIRRAYRLRGELDTGALEAAFRDVLARHDILRTVIRVDGGKPYQYALPVTDIPGLEPVPVLEPLPHKQIRELSAAPFDLAQDPAVRANLLRLPDGDHVLVLTLFHGATDGWSMSPLYRDLGATYASRLHGHAPDWHPLPVQYADYARWQREVFAGSEVAAEQEAFWAAVLAGAPDLSGPRADRPRPTAATGRGANVPFDLPAAAHARLAGWARSANATPFMAMHAALLLTLRWAGAGEDLVIGTATAGRAHPELTDLVGCFLNTVPLRTDLAGNPTAAEFLARVRDADLLAFAHQDLPFDRVVEIVKPSRTLARHPVFQVLLAFDNTGEPELRLPGVEVSEIRVESTAAKFDLALDVTEHRGADGEPNGITGTWEYATDLFDERTIQAMVEDLRRTCDLLGHIDPDRKLDEITDGRPRT